MQDMSGVITEPASSPPRTFTTDVAVEKSVTDAKETKTKATPKIQNEPVEENDKKSAVNLTRGSNNENLKDLACKFCEKVLGSSSSLERHLLVHSGERPFRCKMCDLTFNTNGNMHRHMRSHKQNHDSDSEDSEASGSGTKTSSPSRMPNTRKRRMEYNNNDKPANGTGGHSADDEQTPGAKRKQKNINNNLINDVMAAQSLVCPVCDSKEFASLNVFEIHMEKVHPDYQVKCVSCNLSFKSQRVLNLHRYMVHHTERKDSPNKKAAGNSVSGFKDCTFIDFSSQKFPQIAKTVCEQSVHKSITEQKFRCDQCSRDFPCESALDIHRKACFAFATSSGESEDYAKRRRESSSTDEEIRRDDFFANLDLQNKSPNYTITPRPIVEVRKPSDYYAFNKEIIRPLVDNSKDLADIQSILSVTSAGGLLEQLTQKSHEASPMTPDHNNRGTDDHEEVQDIFAAEFRKMKLRGEFPCRLCTAIFPNLRALKGHNRVHLSGNGPGPYRCNMCPHSSLDKAALVRHMRTHNGDRPYECAVCNYAFTTKANCERHLRNRHSKVTREDVKRSIIYHPSEDPNNDEVNSKLNISREEIKRSVIFTTPENEHREDAERLHNDRSTPVSIFAREPAIAFKDRNLTIPLPRDLSIVIPQPRDILRAHCSVEPVCHNIPPVQEELIQPRLKVKVFGQLTQIPEFHESDAEREPDSEEEIEPAEESYPIKPMNYSLEVPMDLSTGECQEDVLDLSKKRTEKVEEIPVSDAETENHIPKTIKFNNNHTAAMFEKTQMFLAQQQLLKEAHLQKMDPAASFYANQLSQLYRTGAAFPGLGLPPAFSLNPYFLQHNPFFSPPTNPKELAEIKEKIQKEIIRGLQLSGGAIVGMEPHNIVNNMALATERLQAFHQQALNNTASPDIKPHTPAPMIKVEEDVKPPLHINTDTPSTVPFSNPIMSSPKIHKKEGGANHSPNSVKMVIKNGVLMPKQKQRRYRTERPFSCEHCSARFTLRSNMERHIKQQHPQYWSQRQRSNIGLPRKNPISLVPQNITVPSLNYENRLNYIKNLHPNSDLPNTNSNSGEDRDNSSNHSSGIPNKAYSMISDQVKYAILAQQLKSHNNFSQPKNLHSHTEIPVAENEEDDEDDTLVIDEEESVDNKTQVVKDLHVKNVPENTQTLADANLLAKKVAQEILIGVSAKTQHPDISKDFDWKIAGSLISKNPQHHNTQAVIPTFVSQIGQSEDMEVDRSESDNKESKQEEGDLVSVSRLLDNASAQIPFGKYFKNDFSANAEIQPRHDSSIQHQGEGSEEDEEGLVASSGSTSEGNNSGSDENRSESENTTQVPQKKKSAYSLAPNRVSCPYCHRKFPWSSSLRRHVLTHTGQKPYKCPHCPLLFTTKSNCDRHLLRKHGSQTQQTQINATTAPTNAELPPNSVSIPGLGNQGFMMRNVPERPYKCASCPSSTFSTLSNLKKHMSSKHGIHIDDSRPGSPKMEDGHNESGDEPHLTSDDEKKYNDVEFSRKETAKNSPDSSEIRSEWESQISTSKYSPSYLQDVPSNMQNSDLPFKCHLCDHSYAERQDALDHIKDVHGSEYELLMSKGALESSTSFGEEMGSSTPDRTGHRSEGGDEQGEENGEQLRGKFPDYANRKVVCAFCMRRFWSAEDLRRHMRTHTGERPFSCDVCRRRFTLKHSMLRHRKKHAHDSRSCEDLSTASGDEEITSPISSNYSKSTNSTLNSSYASSNHSTSTPKNALTLNGYQLAINKNLSPDIPNNVNNNNSPPAQNYEGKLQLQNIKNNDIKSIRYSTDDNEGQENEMETGNDLIGNLLGISDKRMINKLLSSADEAAKLLGVNK